ncbi:MAG: hypothetical protein M3340_13985 [Actinomycetota bacterium]|nr:hypothetical protein [Actinomycetota bacterium]
MRRALPLLIAALLALPASASAAAPKVQPTDAAAMKSIVRVASAIERCAAKTYDYTSCDDSPRPSTGVRIAASTFTSYRLRAQSRQRRVFFLDRGAGGELLATCTPAGRGACPPSGIWRPRPRPARGPDFARQWLAHERELVARLEAIVGLLDACAASTGDYTGCRTTEVEGLLAWEMLVRPMTFELHPGGYHLSAAARSATQFTTARGSDGTVERHCYKVVPSLVSPCVNGAW